LNGRVRHSHRCWRQKPDDQKADAEVTENAHGVSSLIPAEVKRGNSDPIVKHFPRRQKPRLCPPVASRRPGLLLWRQLSFRLSLRRKFHLMIWVSSCEGNNSNISHVGFHKHGSSARLRYTAWSGAHLRNPARRWHVCHSGTKAHLHNPTGKRHLCHPIAAT